MMRDTNRTALPAGWLRALHWIGIGLLIFLLGLFVASEWDGLVRLAEFIAEAARSIPDFVEEIIAYYRQLPADQFLPSLMIGGVFGGLVTAALYLARAEVWALPPLTLAWVGLLVLALALIVGATLWMALFLGLISAVVLSYAFQPEFRAFFSLPNLRKLAERRALIMGGRGLLIGVLGGGLGSQLLTYPTQHCTYAPDISRVQYNLGVLITLAGAVIALFPLWSLVISRRGRLTAGGTAGYFRGRLMPFGLLLPNLLVMVVFLYYPAVQMVTLSLKLRRFPLPQEKFVCLDNYVALAQDKVYQNSLLVTALITVGLVMLTLSLALGIAVLASQKVRGASIYRTLLIWPFALSPVVSGVIFLSMFREGNVGVINYFLESTVGISASWLRDTTLAPLVVILASVWNAIGFNVLFYIAGLQNIPQDLLDAAAIDGANRVERFFRITFPLLSPFTFFLMVTNVTYAFYGIYGVVDTLTQGGPPLGPGGQDGGATDVLIYKLYEDAFGSGAPVGQAAAQALILFLMVASITLLQFRYIESRVTYNA